MKLSSNGKSKESDENLILESYFKFLLRQTSLSLHWKILIVVGRFACFQNVKSNLMYFVQTLNLLEA
jgi:hypothetical protein